MVDLVLLVDEGDIFSGYANGIPDFRSVKGRERQAGMLVYTDPDIALKSDRDRVCSPESDFEDSAASV